MLTATIDASIEVSKPTFTMRELEVLKLLFEGKSNIEIAKYL